MDTILFRQNLRKRTELEENKKMTKFVKNGKSFLFAINLNITDVNRYKNSYIVLNAIEEIKSNIYKCELIHKDDVFKAIVDLRNKEVYVDFFSNYVRG